FCVDPRELRKQGIKEVLPAPEQNGIGKIAYILSQGDVVFPVLHGTYGEDGAVQGLLEMVGIPYVGAGVGGSALGMDKVMMKAVFGHCGLPVTPYVWSTVRDFELAPDALVSEAESSLKYPLFVKPASLGSSVGVTKVRNRQELLDAVREAARYDRKVMVEQGVEAREIEISVMGNDDPETSLPGEIVPGADFYDYNAKYLSGSTMLIPADISAELAAQARDMAVRVYRAIDCHGLARVDFFLLKDNSLLVNEINTMPGFTVNSMYPKMWDATGLDYTSLITSLISLAFDAFESKRRISTSLSE
ncbi:MAG TPA: D-alanine--D-alanine ligase family protein, partial [Bacillota bacterium]|nr:D-alanine--D-alanine ligase family protein [Bacillota bacterium]